MEKRRVSIFGNFYQGLHLPALSSFIINLSNSGFEVMIEESFASYLREKRSFPHGDCHTFEEYDGRSEAVISVGGDGTFLRTARAVGEYATPILGLNTGHLGFLSHSTLHEAADVVESLLEQNYRIEERMLLEVSGEGLPDDVWPFALNEVAILKEETASMINASITLNGHFLADYLADGVVISTPTGSTAYNLAAGGPLLQPTLSCMAISPIAPHTLTMRPMVVESSSEIMAITTSRSHHYRVSLDGDSFRMVSGSNISIRKAEFCVRIILRPEDNFAASLRNKLLWGRR